MPWDVTSHQDFVANVRGIENPLTLEVRVDPAINQGADVVCTYTGTAIVGTLRFQQDHAPSPDRWSRGYLSFLLPTPGRTWTFIPPSGLPRPRGPVIPEKTDQLTYFHRGTVALSLASISNSNAANNAGWAVDGANLYVVGVQTNGLVVEAKIALRDSDGFLHRLGYQVTALGTGPLPHVGGVAHE